MLCLAPRSDREVYDLAEGLACSGLLDAEDIDSLWDALAILVVVEEDVGLDGWDSRPEPAPEGTVRAAVAAATEVLSRRDERRCGALMPRARTHCIRRAGHPGPHRSR